MAELLPNAKAHFDDNNGNPLAGGSVFFYIPNTSTLKSTYQDAGQTILNTNPVILDARGEALIWGSGIYRQVVYDNLGNLIWDQITEGPNANLTGSITDAKYVSGTDFTPGVTTVLTLPSAPGAVSNMWVFFDGVYQSDDQIASLNGLTLTLALPIPVGVGEVNIKIGTTVAIGVPGSGTVGDSQIAWGTILSRSVDSVAALSGLNVGIYRRATTTGYYTPGDGGQGSYYYSSSSTAAVNGGTVVSASGGVGRWLLEFSTLNAKQFGLKGDGDLLGGGTDDTVRFQALLSASAHYSAIYFPPGCYNVTSVTFDQTLFDRTFTFDNAIFFGIATTATDSIFLFAGCDNCKFDGKWTLTSDGINNTPTYALNYGSAIHLTCGTGFNSCFLWFYGMDIRNIKAGFVNGAFIGNAAQANAEASEIWIEGANFRGVLQPIYCNAQSGYVVVSDSCLAAQQFEAGSWWVPGQGFCVRNEALPTGQGNHILLQGCEFQRTDTLVGNWLYGGNIVIQGLVFEVAQTAFLTGDVSISGDIDGFFGPGSTSVFTIAGPGSTGTLLLDNFRCDRPPGTASTDRTNIVNASGSINYRVVMQNCHLREWFYTASEGSSQLVSGCQFDYHHLTIDNSTTTSWYLDQLAGNSITNADLSSHSISTTGSSAAQGGWICPGSNAGNAYVQNVGNSPFPTDTSSFQVVTTAAGFVLQTQTTNRFNVEGNRTYTLEMPVKNGGSSTGGFISMGLSFYDFGGNLLSPGTAGQLDEAFMAPAGFNAWNMLRGPVTTPPNAVTAAFVLNFGINTNVFFYHPKVK